MYGWSRPPTNPMTLSLLLSAAAAPARNEPSFAANAIVGDIRRFDPGIDDEPGVPVVANDRPDVIHDGARDDDQLRAVRGQAPELVGSPLALVVQTLLPGQAKVGDGAIETVLVEVVESGHPGFQERHARHVSERGCPGPIGNRATEQHDRDRQRDQPDTRPALEPAVCVASGRLLALLETAPSQTRLEEFPFTAGQMQDAFEAPRLELRQSPAREEIVGISLG